MKKLRPLLFLCCFNWAIAESEPNGTQGQAELVEWTLPEWSFEGEISGSSDVDWVNCRSFGSGEVKFSLRYTHSSAMFLPKAHLKGELFDASGQLLGELSIPFRFSNGINVLNLTYQLPESGDYFVKVSSLGGANPSYQLSAVSQIGNDDREENDTLAGAADLGEVDEFFLGDLALEGPGEWDYYRLRVPVSGSYKVQLVFEQAKGDLDLFLYQEGTRVSASMSESDNETLVYSLVAGLDYVVGVGSRKSGVFPGTFEERSAFNDDYVLWMGAAPDGETEEEVEIWITDIIGNNGEWTGNGLSLHPTMTMQGGPLGNQGGLNPVKDEITFEEDGIPGDFLDFAVGTCGVIPLVWNLEYESEAGDLEASFYHPVALLESESKVVPTSGLTVKSYRTLLGTANLEVEVAPTNGLFGPSHSSHPSYSFGVALGEDRFEEAGNNERGDATGIGGSPMGRLDSLTLTKGDRDWYRWVAPKTGVVRFLADVMGHSEERRLRVYRDELLLTQMESQTGLVVVELPARFGVEEGDVIDLEISHEGDWVGGVYALWWGYEDGEEPSDSPEEAVQLGWQLPVVREDLSLHPRDVDHFKMGIFTGPSEKDYFLVCESDPGTEVLVEDISYNGMAPTVGHYYWTEGSHQVVLGVSLMSWFGADLEFWVTSRASVPIDQLKVAVFEATDYHQWLLDHRMAPGFSRFESDDPNGDGLPLGVEFALGLTPNHGGGDRIHLQPSEDGGLEWLLEAGPGGTIAPLFIERSRDLESWETIDGDEASAGVNPIPVGSTIVRIPALPGERREFLRLRLGDE